ncbi:MAG TPA: radical SAM protein, partial [Planctomycetota bacterium]|nr:radical SAM protein [Planctomycetota bacterium]
MLSIHDAPAVETEFRRAAVDPHLLRRFRIAFFKKSEPAADALAIVPAPARAALGGVIDFHALALEHELDSGVDGATKLVFRMRSGLRLESVILRIATGRTALCVSSQVGCAASCAFCATGHMGIAQNLSAAEILDQIVQANLILAREGRRARNIVFMGMGEPFHNEEAVIEAVDRLVAPEIFAHPQSRILISTVGIADAMVRTAERFPRVGLALSLHAARQEVRERIVPLARKIPVEALREAVMTLNAIQSRPVMVECVLFDGVNDAPEDVAALIDWCAGLDVHVNLIPYNPIDDAPHLGPVAAERQREISEELKRAGLVVTTRYSLGQDIEAA